MVYVETNNTREIQSRLLDPHYTDDRFRKSQTVYLAPGHTTKMNFGVPLVKVASYDYSDRLLQWYGRQCDEAWNAAAKLGFEKNSAQLIEAFLRELFKDPNLELVHIVAGVNVGNGYGYRVYGYIRGI